MANLFTNLWNNGFGFGSSEKRSASYSGYADINEESFIKALGLDTISVNATHKTAMGISSFFGNVRIISNLIASTPFGVSQKLKTGGSKDADDHALNYCISKRSNRHMSPFIAMRTMISNALVYGYAIARIDKTGSDYEYYPFPSSCVSILEDTDTGYLFFQLTERGKLTYYSEDEVVFIKDLSFDGKRGVSIVNWQKSTIKMSLLTSGFLDKYYEKGTFAAGFLEQPVLDMNDAEKVQKYKDAVLKSLKGHNSGFGMAIIGQGGKWHPVARSPVESQLMETFNRSDRDFARMFGIPLSMLGDTEKQTSWGTGVEQMFIVVTKTVLIPLATQIEQEFNYKCFDRNEVKKGYYTKFNFHALLRGDSASQAAYIRSCITTGTMSPNEARALDERGPIPGGDKFYMQGAMMPMELLGKDKAQNENSGKTVSESGNE